MLPTNPPAAFVYRGGGEAPKTNGLKY